MSTSKKILIPILAIVYALCLGINIWYLSVMLFGDQKIVSDTYYVGIQTATKEDGTADKDYFIEVNYMADMFEIKFNYMLDEKQTGFYSQGLQFLLDENGEMKFHYKKTEKDREEHSSGWWLSHEMTYNQYVDGALWDTHQFNYMSDNNYENCLISTNPINNNSFFKIQIGDKLYGMKFKGHKYGFNANNFTGVTDTINSPSYTMKPWIVNNYYSADFVYFSELIYKACESLENGVNHAITFEFADMFDYYEYVSEGVYKDDPIVSDKVQSIQKEVKSYYTILVHKSADKVTKSSDSMFNCVAGKVGYNNSDEIQSEDYFVGRTIVLAEIYDFDLVNVASNNYALNLNSKFRNGYEKISDKICLDILINLDYFKENNMEFVGFSANVANDFNIYRCRTFETVDGEIIYSEVAYD